MFLLLLRHADWKAVFDNITCDWMVLIFLIPLWYFIDWVSLFKARLGMNVVSERQPIRSSLYFLSTDITISYCLNLFALVIVRVFGKFIMFPFFQLMFGNHRTLDANA